MLLILFYFICLIVCIQDETIRYLENLVLQLQEQLDVEDGETDATDAVDVPNTTNEPTWLAVMRKDKIYR